MDNIFVESFREGWRTIKYEEVYLKAYQNGIEARAGIGAYLHFYDWDRPYQAQGYRTPGEVYNEGPATPPAQPTERGWSRGRALEYHVGVASYRHNSVQLMCSTSEIRAET